MGPKIETVRAKRPKTGGRKKGSRNKFSVDLKGMILKALNDGGGVKYLKEQKKQNPTAFLTLVGKVLPLSIDANHAGTITVRWKSET